MTSSMTQNTTVKTFEAGAGHENYTEAQRWARAEWGWAVGPDTWADDERSWIVRLHMDRASGRAALVEYRRVA